MTTNIDGSPIELSTRLFSKERIGNDLFNVAWYLVKGGMPPVEIYQVMTGLSRWCGYNEGDAIIVATRAVDAALGKETHMGKEVKEWIDSTSGDFTIKEIREALKFWKREEYKNLNKILSRMCEKGEIKRVGDKNGVYRAQNVQLEEMQWWEADIAEIPLQFPLCVEDLVKIMPRNIIVVAGSPNSGKTAFLLNTVKYNWNKGYSQKYLSSEMSFSELKARLLHFEDTVLQEWRDGCKFFERCSNFPEAIDPEAINYIDFLELSEDFWKVGRILKEIHEKLTTGIAIVALQKKYGAEMGRGAEFALEKPRLYLTMDHNVMLIKKGKNWRGSVNPNGMQVKFKLVKGARFSMDGIWDYAVEKKNKGGK